MIKQNEHHIDERRDVISDWQLERNRAVELHDVIPSAPARWRSAPPREASCRSQS